MCIDVIQHNPYRRHSFAQGISIPKVFIGDVDEGCECVLPRGAREIDVRQSNRLVGDCATYDLAIGGVTIVSHLLRIRVDRQNGVRFASIAQAPH